MFKRLLLAGSVGLAVLGAVLPFAQASDSDLVIYSSRKAHLLEPLVEAYQNETGKTIVWQTDKPGALIARLEAEGKRSPADIFMTVDAGNLWLAEDKGLLQRIDRRVLNNRIPSEFVSQDKQWYGFSKRARTLVYNTDKVSAKELSTYEDLANDEWSGKLCLRTSSKVYNLSLIGSMLEAKGEAQTKEVLEGWVENLAQPVFSSDSQAIKAVAAGQCQVTVVNTYYVARYLKANPDAPVKVFWPNQSDRGVHVNVAGAGVTRNAPNKAEAIAFMEWMASDQAQTILAQANNEYPVVEGVKTSEIVESWGKFESDDVSVYTFGKRQPEAIRMADMTGYR